MHFQLVLIVEWEGKEIMKMKEKNNKFIIGSIIVLALTFITCLLMCFSFRFGFDGTKTIWSHLTSNVSANNPGSGEYALISLFITGTALGMELFFYLAILYLFVLVPIAENVFVLFLSVIARLFQIGKERRWKDIVTKVLLIISVIFQGMLCVYSLILAFTGFSLFFIIHYFVTLINILAFIHYIKLLKKDKAKVEASLT